MSPSIQRNHFESFFSEPEGIDTISSFSDMWGQETMVPENSISWSSKKRIKFLQETAGTESKHGLCF